jgi:hypothetical protein
LVLKEIETGVLFGHVSQHPVEETDSQQVAEGSSTGK